MHYPTISFHVLCLKIIEYFFFFEILHYISVIINEMYFKFKKKRHI